PFLRACENDAPPFHPCKPSRAREADPPACAAKFQKARWQQIQNHQNERGRAEFSFCPATVVLIRAEHCQSTSFCQRKPPAPSARHTPPSRSVAMCLDQKTQYNPLAPRDSFRFVRATSISIRRCFSRGWRRLRAPLESP